MATLFAREMKGIILAGGTGSRLYPATHVISKHLLPVYNKPMIYYPLSILMLAKITEVLIITNPQFINLYRDLLGDGSRFGISIKYAVQDKPRGIADAFMIGKEFIENDNVCLILGDNIFHGHQIPEVLQSARNQIEKSGGAMVFGYNVGNPSEYGVIQYDSAGNILSIEEKPANPKSDCAAVGIYMYDNDIINIVRDIGPSSRNELEITDVNEKYLQDRRLFLKMLGRGVAWFDAGNCDSLFKASAFVQNIEKRQGLKIACLEEVAYYMGYISRTELDKISQTTPKSKYGNYLSRIQEYS